MGPWSKFAKNIYSLSLHNVLVPKFRIANEACFDFKVYLTAEKWLILNFVDNSTDGYGINKKHVHFFLPNFFFTCQNTVNYAKTLDFR